MGKAKEKHNQDAGERDDLPEAGGAATSQLREDSDARKREPFLTPEEQEKALLLAAIIERFRRDLWQILSTIGDVQLGGRLAMLAEPCRSLAGLIRCSGDDHYSLCRRQLEKMADECSEMRASEAALVMGMIREAVEMFLARYCESGFIPDDAYDGENLASFPVERHARG